MISKEQEKLIEQDWDIYWANKDKPGNAVYDFLAGIYRRLIVKNILTHFILKIFKKREQVLHAGCGSGQVDTDITTYIDITALDISANALKIYRSIHGANCKAIQGSIFQLPFLDNSFDGIYNLGVMEHFTEDEIQDIFIEFRRVLKPGGRILILWPPTFGFTVFVLDSAHFILNNIFRLHIKLHPDEITRIRSKQHAVNILTSAKFKDIRYYFGIKDLFTQVVLSAVNSK